MAAALASPARIPPSSQTMDSSSESAFDSSDKTYRISRDGYSQSSCSMRSEEYRQLFRLPSEEVLVQDFNCALQENIFLQGHMYLFEHYICFYSNIFGFETKKIISFQDVTSVRRAKTAGIFPNAIEIMAAGRKYFFASFVSRDEAFKIIADGWSQPANGPKGVLDQQDSKAETSSELSGVMMVENANSSDSPVRDSDLDERNWEVSRSENSKLPSSHVDDNAGSTASEVDVAEEKRDGLLIAEPSTSSRCINWNQETWDAPEIPKCYTKVVESKFPINVEQFFNLFFSDDAIGFVESFHRKCGDKDLRCTSWSPHDKFGCTREKSFQHPIKIYFGAKCGGCKETQIFQVYKSSHLVIKTSQEVSDVPYADYFCVEGLWDVQKLDDKSEGCILQVYVNVAFSKKTMWKGKIEQSTMEECRETYAIWIDLAHELLKQKNVEKTEEGATVDMLNCGQVVRRNTRQSGEHSQRLHGNAEHGRRMRDAVANSRGTHEQTGNSLQANLLHGTTGVSAWRTIAVKFSLFLKSQGNLQLFLVITLSIILLLMQLSIVVLLSRPQQVYVIPQVDQLSSVGLESGQRGAEAVAWMDKRVHLLKDDMLVVEAQLERMRREHNLLKAQLKDLERVTKRQR